MSSDKKTKSSKGGAGARRRSKSRPKTMADGSNFKRWESKSLKTGDALPPPTKRLLRVYSMRFCPFAQRTLLALAAKGVPVEILNLNLKQKPEWMADKNPTGQVPILELDGEVVYGSLHCNEWLNETYPDKGQAIHGASPTARAHQRMLAERLDGLLGPCFQFLGAKSDETEAKLQEKVDLFEKLLEGEYFGGKEASFVDYAVWPMLERLDAVALASDHTVGIKEMWIHLTESAHPKLHAYWGRMQKRPEVRFCWRGPEAHLGFMKTFITGQDPDYDAGL